MLGVKSALIFLLLMYAIDPLFGCSTDPEPPTVAPVPPGKNYNYFCLILGEKGDFSRFEGNHLIRFKISFTEMSSTKNNAQISTTRKTTQTTTGKIGYVSTTIQVMTPANSMTRETTTKNTNTWNTRMETQQTTKSPTTMVTTTSK